MSVNQKINQPLSAEELKTLNTLLCKGNHLGVFELHGVLCGFLSSSGTLPMKVCLDAVLRKENMNSNDEMKQIRNLITRLDKQIVGDLMNAELFFPMIDYESIDKFSSESLNELQRRHLSLWCCGYVYAMGLDVAHWIVQGLQEEFLMFLQPLFTLSKEILIWAGVEKDTESGVKKRVKHQIIDEIPSLIPAIYAVWHDKNGRLKNHATNRLDFDQYAYRSDKKFEEYYPLRGSLH